MNVLAQMLPPSASNLGHDVDKAWNVILWTTTFFFAIVVGAMVLFMVKYRRRTPNDTTSPITHNTAIEIIWTVVPLILVLIFFFVGFTGFLKYDNPPSNCVVITAEAQQWKFNFKYPNGGEDENLYLLKDQPVRIDMYSKDVLHALYIPEFRTQRNFVPGRMTNIWFIPTDYSPPGSMAPSTAAAAAPAASGPAGPTIMEGGAVDPGGWAMFCTQYCGDGHSRMMGRVFVLDKEHFDEKMREISNPFKKKINGKNVWVPYVDLGKKLYNQLGCSSCHSVDEKDKDNTSGTGPPWHGLVGRDHQFSVPAGADFKGNDEKVDWDGYLKESMLQPDAKLVIFGGKSYHGMPSFASQLSGNIPNVEKQRALGDYIKSLGTTGWKPKITPEANPDLFDADNPKFFDENKQPVHPESLAAQAAQSRPATAP